MSTTTKRTYYQKNRELIRQKQAIYRATKRAELNAYGKEYYQTNQEHQRQQRKERLRRAKMGAYEALGCRCAHCGFSDTRALQIDHVSGGGKHDHPKRGEKYYRHVQAEVLAGSPKYQLLCANCNWIKRHENGEQN